MSDNKPYRIAIRQEGAMVNAYWARTSTMEGAELVASMSRELCQLPRMWETFQMVMEAAAAELTLLRLGRNAVIIERQDAPEHERAGNA